MWGAGNSSWHSAAAHPSSFWKFPAEGGGGKAEGCLEIWSNVPQKVSERGSMSAKDIEGWEGAPTLGALLIVSSGGNPCPQSKGSMRGGRTHPCKFMPRGCVPRSYQNQVSLIQICSGFKSPLRHFSSVTSGTLSLPACTSVSTSIKRG